MAKKDRLRKGTVNTCKNWIWKKFSKLGCVLDFEEVLNINMTSVPQTSWIRFSRRDSGNEVGSSPGGWNPVKLFTNSTISFVGQVREYITFNKAHGAGIWSTRVGLFCYELAPLTFGSPRYLWVSNDTLLSQQKGVFRVNCIDCLDRTNVVQVVNLLFAILVFYWFNFPDIVCICPSCTEPTIGSGSTSESRYSG